MTLAIDVPDAQLERLRAVAAQLGVSVEYLARAIIEAQLAQPAAALERAAEHVLQKNQELYRRLS